MIPAVNTQGRAFANLFYGRMDAYGLGRGEVVRDELTLHHYVMHLAGHDSGIGVFPMMDDDMVKFGAIDLDEPDFDFARELQEFIPGASWIERSRSGNAHVWVFFAEPAPAWAVRGVLKAALEVHGRNDVEVFPKQDTLREGMLGNYINLPYHGTERPILDPTFFPDELLLEEFIQRAHNAGLQQPDAWVRRAQALGIVSPENRPSGADFGTRENLHPCAEYIYENREKNPLQPGHRHAVLFALSKQLLNWKAIKEDRARRMVHEVNEAGAQPAAANEVDRIFDTVITGGYTSTGCNEPLVIDYVRPDCKIAHS